MEQFSPFQCDTKLRIRPRLLAWSRPGKRIFFHVDLDAFFASVEQLKNPRLRGKPVIVGGRNSRRGVVAAASYEAKRFGVETGMPWPEARRKCPRAVFLPADFDAYADYSEKVRRLLEKAAPVVAVASVDEAFLDLTGCERLYGTPRMAAEKIHREILEKVGLSVSIGIAGSQAVAKMASKMAKPRGMMEVPAGAEVKFLFPLPVTAMPGIGDKIGGRLREMGILTLGQLARMPDDILRASFGVYGPYLKAKAKGEDGWALEVTEIVRSVGKQKTLERDITDWEEIRRELLQLVEGVGRSLREKKLRAGRVAVHLRFHDFTSAGTSETLKDPASFDRVLFRRAEGLLKPLVAGEKPVRLVGFTAENLCGEERQLDLFRTPKALRWERFYAALDTVRKIR